MSSYPMPSSSLWTTSAYSLPQSPSLTPEERERLRDLESQLNQHRKFEKLKKFKALPCHIRQDIVDNSYLKDLLYEITSNKCDETFENLEELNRLRLIKNNNIFISTSYGVPYDVHLNSYDPKYDTILNLFNTEELAKAHAEACLEENLSS